MEAKTKSTMDMIVLRYIKDWEHNPNGQVVEAVKYLHDHGVTHNDIKDENIIVER